MTYRISTDKTYLETKAELGDQFRKWGVSEWHVNRSDSTYGATVTVEWFPAGSQNLRALSSNDQARPQDNLRKLYLIVEALRLNEARGLEAQMREYYLQLPAPPTSRDPFEVLGVRSDTDLEDIEAIYKNKAKRLHPDTSAEDGKAMTELNVAMDRIRAEKLVGAK